MSDSATSNASGKASRHVVYIITSLAMGGAQQVLLQLLKGKPVGYQPLCVVTLRRAAGIEEKVRELGVPVLHLELNKPWLLPGKLFGLWRLLRRQPADVLFSLMPHANLFTAVLQKVFRWRGRLIWNLHNTPDAGLYPRRIHQLILWLSYYAAQTMPDKIVVVSERSQQRYLQLGYPADKLVLIHNGVEVSAHDHSAAQRFQATRQRIRDEFALAAEAVLIGSLTRYVPAKNIPLMLQAFRLLLDQYVAAPPLRLLLAGEGMMAGNAELQQLIRCYQLEDKVLLLGIRSDAGELIRALDIATLSSRSESLPLFMVESMAAGVLCVATDVGDMGVLLGGTGWLVPSERADLLAAAWGEVLQMAEGERLQRVQLARQRVLAEYSVEGMLEHYADVLY